MSQSIDFTTTLTIIECAACSMAFGITEDFEARRRKDHKGFHCPAGHSNVFRGKTEEERLRERLRLAEDATARERAYRDQAEASLRATKGVVTRQRKRLDRVANGVCPECNRSFVNLARHMETKHPGCKS